MSKIKSPPAPAPAMSLWRATQAVLEDKGIAEAFDAAAAQKATAPEDKEFAAIYEAAQKGSKYSLHPATVLVNALATVAGDDGVIDAGELKKIGGRFSPLALQLVEKAKVAKPATSVEMAKLTAVGLSPTTKQALAKTTETLAGLSTMPVLSSLVDDVAARQPLKGHRLFAVQHLFASTFGLFEALEKAGVEAKGSMVFGKNYSTNVEVKDALSDRGYDVVDHYGARAVIHDDKGNIVGLESPLLSGLRRSLADAAAQKPPQRVLLLDEGGKLNRMLHDVFPQYAHLCTIVEQTTNGLQNMAGVTLQAPAVSVASSQLKRDVEGPIIGEDVCATTLEQLERLDPGIAAGKTVGIVGYGAVGSATAEAFAKRGFTVVVTDTNDAMLKRLGAGKQLPGGGSIVVKPRNEVLGAGILVGCTGTGACTTDELRFVKDGAFLVNAASGDHEFPTFETEAARRQGLQHERHAMRDWQGQFDAFADAIKNKKRGPIVIVDGLGPTIVEPQAKMASSSSTGIAIDFPRGNGTTFEAAYSTGGPLAHQYFANGPRTFAVLRGGTPINMERDLPPTTIQLTRSMLFAACIQAVDEREPGWKNFSANTQLTIEQRWRQTSA